MRAIRKVTVRTSLPTRLGRLEALASNLRWSWHEPTRELFREISLAGWRATGHDPVQLLGWVGTERIQQLAARNQADVAAATRALLARSAVDTAR